MQQSQTCCSVSLEDNFDTIQLKKSIICLNNEVQMLEKIINETNQSYKDLEEKYKIATEDIKRLNEDLDAERSYRTFVKEYYNESVVNELKKQIETLNRDINEYKLVNDNREREIVQIEQKYNNAKKENSELIETITNLGNYIDKNRNEMNIDRTYTRKMEDECKKNNEIIKSLELRLRLTKIGNTKLQFEKNDLKRFLSDLDKVNSDLSIDLIDTRQALRDEKASHAITRKKCAGFEESYNHLKKVKCENENTIEYIRNKISKLADKNVKLTNEINDQNKTIMELNDQLQKVTTELSSSENKFEKLKRKTSEITAAIFINEIIKHIRTKKPEIFHAITNSFKSIITVRNDFCHYGNKKFSDIKSLNDAIGLCVGFGINHDQAKYLINLVNEIGTVPETFL